MPTAKKAPTTKQAPPAKPKVFTMSFARVYPLYVQKAEKRARMTPNAALITGLVCAVRVASIRR